jgi:hypothetical protein
MCGEQVEDRGSGDRRDYEERIRSSTFLRSSDGILGMIPEIFLRADARLTAAL